MGNLPLSAVLLDGARVQGGWYYYSGRDALHNPLFVVGGSQVPLFISLTTNAQGESVWAYSTQWADVHLNLPPSPLLAAVISLCAGLFGAAVIAAYSWKTKKRAQSDPTPRPGSEPACSSS